MDNDQLDQIEAEQQKLERRVTRKVAAAYLEVSVRTMEDWDRKGLPPKAFKFGKRGVLYPVSVLTLFKAQREQCKQSCARQPQSPTINEAQSLLAVGHIPDD